MLRKRLCSIVLLLSMVFMFTACGTDTINTADLTEPQDSVVTDLASAEKDTDIQEEPETPVELDENSSFEVHYLDVGQADAALVLCDDKTMLIDGGNPSDSSLIAAYLKKHSISHLDYVVCSHAHDDHVGGLPGALSVATAGAVYAPKTGNDIKSYQSFKSKTQVQGLTIQNPVPGSSIKFGSSTVDFLGPITENSSDLNNTSIVLKITYGETSFLFTGDAEREEEQDILAKNYDLSATILTEFLRNDELFNKEKFAEYIKSEPDNILSNAYRDPYYLSYELKQSAMSQGNHFQSRHYGSIGMGSVPYYNFIININDTNAVCDKIKSIAEESILNSVSTVEYFGGGEYENVKSVVLSLYQSGKSNEKMDFVLPIGYNNAATITKLKTADHCMLLGNFEESGYNYSGKLDVLAKVLTTNYLLPEMRGKYGAYGAGIFVDKSGFTSSVSGMENIETALMVWNGMGDYLRNLDMTQKQLDAVIVTVVKEFDEWYNDSDYAAQMALMDKSADDIKKTRDEMLSTTVEDLIGYADFIDKCVSQGHIYAVLSKEAADNAKFDFSYYANSETIKIIPQLTRNPQGYIKGKAENTFAPDDYITRAEVAGIIDRIIADKRNAKYPGVFSDVNKNEWYYNAVVSLNEKGIINGYETGKFKPGNYITRAELATILSKFIYNADTDTGVKFSDINGDEWYYTSISAMIGKGYITGYEDNTIRPNQPVTRAETVAIINRMLGLSAPANNENTFVDVDTAHWAYNDIMTASK